jgi:hypothetical protein
LQVSLKVEAKGVTNYAEVADELVAEYKIESERAGQEISLIDQKNIRRRVYDALNVLRAMNVISKTKKEISWVGLPCEDSDDPAAAAAAAASAAAGATRRSAARGRAAPQTSRQAANAALMSATAVAAKAANGDDDDDEGGGGGGGGALLTSATQRARTARDEANKRITEKRAQHDELLAQQIWYRNLLSRNVRDADRLLAPDVERLTLPFIIINTRSHAVIELVFSCFEQRDFHCRGRRCQVSPGQTEYFFSVCTDGLCLQLSVACALQFSDPFEIHDDNYLLQAMHRRQVST